MDIYILFTCDSHKSHASRVLRGVFTDVELLNRAKETLIENDVSNDFNIVEIEENTFEEDGGYY
jgi:hypothetical protein